MTNLKIKLNKEMKILFKDHFLYLSTFNNQIYNESHLLQFLLYLSIINKRKYLINNLIKLKKYYDCTKL